jgi:hypothetical protein
VLLAFLAAEADHLIQLAEPNLVRSGVVKTAEDGAGSAAVHSIRTSSGMFLERGQDAVVRGERVGLLMLWVAVGSSSAQQPHEPRSNFEEAPKCEG